MYKFGKSPPRALNSFGISGLLEEVCRVYYDNLFSTRHLGRVSDLFCARLREFGVDELRVRSLLLYSFFEAYRSHSNALGTEALLEPLVIECGFDSEKAAIGMVFRTGIGLDTDGMADRIFNGTPNGAFEELLCRLHLSCDQLVIRVQVGVQMEVVSLFGIDPSIVTPGSKRPMPEVAVMVGASQVGESPKATEYIELGDLDYRTMLAADEAGVKLERPGEAFVPGELTELEQAIRVRGQSRPGEDIRRIKASAKDGAEEVIRIQGGGKQDLVDHSTMTIASDEAMEVEEEEITTIKPLKGLFKKVWPFKKKETAEEEGDGAVPEEVIDYDAQSAEYDALLAESEPVPVVAESEEFESPIAEEALTETESVATDLMVEIESGSLDRTLHKAQEEMKEIKKDLSSGKAKRWVDGLMGDLVQEKSRLHDLTKKLNKSIRQKELEFRNKEVALQEEIRRRDEMLRQKNNALNRTKDQLGLVQMTLDKLKSAQQERGEDSQYKQKFNMTQRLLTASKDENARLASKVDDLKSQLASAQMGLKSKTGGPSQAEFSALKVKHERIVRQAEELRNMNDQLTSRIQQLAERVDVRPTATTLVLERKLEAAVKQVGLSQKEAEQLKLKVDELQREEARLRMELARAQGGKPGSPKGGSKPRAA